MTTAITNRKLFFSFLTLSFLGSGLGLCQESLEVGAVSLGARLRLDSYTHKLGDNWSVSKVGYKNINYNYTFNESTPTADSWKSVFGQTRSVDMALRPHRNLSGNFEFEFIGDYADRFWMPVNFEHRLRVENKNFYWNKGEIEYLGDWWSLRYFKNIGHYNWSYEGD